MSDRERLLVLLRHGESIWNRDNRFSGWTDVDLSDTGVRQAHDAAALLLQGGYTFDVAFTSVLKRAIRTLWIVLDEMDQMWVPVHRSWRLNERHYGALQGLNKAETAARLGQERVHAWRRSYGVRPPALERGDPREPAGDPRYSDIDADLLPRAESLAETIARVLPYWENAIAPDIQAGKRVLLVAHGNSLRALVKHIDSLTDEEVAALNIPTGIPLVYHLDESLRPNDHRYLGDEDAITAAIESVASQAGVMPDRRLR